MLNLQCFSVDILRLAINGSRPSDSGRKLQVRVFDGALALGHRDDEQR